MFVVRFYNLIDNFNYKKFLENAESLLEQQNMIIGFNYVRESRQIDLLFKNANNLLNIYFNANRDNIRIIYHRDCKFSVSEFKDIDYLNVNVDLDINNYKFYNSYV